MRAASLTIQADLPTVLSVAALIIAAVILGPIVSRVVTARRSRRLAADVARAVPDALNSSHSSHQARPSDRNDRPT